MTDPTDSRTRDLVALEQVRYRYAAALDGLDAALLRSVFEPDGVFRTFVPGATEPRSEIRGHAQIEKMVEAMPRLFERTHHVMTNPLTELDGERATGTVQCASHHLIVDDGRRWKFVTYLGYEDEFRRGADGEWRIAVRDARFLWAEEVPVPDWADISRRGRLG